MRQGSDPRLILLAPGESATVRIVAVGTPQRERVGTHLEKLQGDIGPGHVYRFTADSEVGVLQHVVAGFEFESRNDPPARYEVFVEGSDGTARIEAPPVVQPAVGCFPQTVSYALSFRVSERDEDVAEASAQGASDSDR